MIIKEVKKEENIRFDKRVEICSSPGQVNSKHNRRI